MYENSMGVGLPVRDGTQPPRDLISFPYENY